MAVLQRSACTLHWHHKSKLCVQSYLSSPCKRHHCYAAKSNQTLDKFILLYEFRVSIVWGFSLKFGAFLWVWMRVSNESVAAGFAFNGLRWGKLKVSKIDWAFILRCQVSCISTNVHIGVFYIVGFVIWKSYCKPCCWFWTGTLEFVPKLMNVKESPWLMWRVTCRTFHYCHWLCYNLEVWALGLQTAWGELENNSWTPYCRVCNRWAEETPCIVSSWPREKYRDTQKLYSAILHR